MNKKEMKACEMALALEPVLSQITYAQWIRLKDLVDRRFDERFRKESIGNEGDDKLKMSLTIALS